MKRTIILIFSMALLAGIAHSQHIVDIEQFDGSDAYIKQANRIQIVKGIDGGSDLTDGNALTQESGSELWVNQYTNAWKTGLTGNILQAEQLEGTQYIKLNQQGSNNSAWIHQSGGSDNVVDDLRQWGDNTEAIITQEGNYNRVESGKYRANRVDYWPQVNIAAHQGSNSVLELEQIGDFNTLMFNQLNENIIRIKQENGARAEINQVGELNIFAKHEDGTGLFESIGSDLYLLQKGDQNIVFGEQINPGSEANIVQDGMTNVIEFIQQ